MEDKTEAVLNKITIEVIEEAYLLSKQVYEGNLSIQDAQLTLTEKFDMHKGSARDYVNNFQIMMKGECYQRTMNGTATKYYLNKIKEEFGKDQLQLALSSVSQHVKYYEQFSNGKLRNIRSIIENLSDEQVAA